MKIVWAITGAGHLLVESMDVLVELSEKHDVSVVFSKAGLEVVKLYGYYKMLEEFGKREGNQLIFEEDEEFSYSFSGKLTYEKYDYVIISPTTANTTAKIVHGIADTLVTNVAAQSGKGQIPLIVVPVDQEEGLVLTRIPPYINKDLCRSCEICEAKSVCPVDAIIPPKIDAAKCIRCMQCRDSCSFNSIVTDETMQLYIRKIDAENTRKLKEIENITVINHPEKIMDILNN